MTRDEIFAVVRDMSGQTSATDASLGYMTAILEGELNLELLKHPRMRTRSSWIITTPSAVQPYDGVVPLLPVPDSLLALLNIMDANSNRYKIAPQVLLDRRHNRGHCQHTYIDRGDGYDLQPIPAVGSEYRLDYYQAIPGLTSSNQQNWISRFFSHLYVYGVLKNMAIYIKDRENAPTWTPLYEQALQAVKGQGWNQNIAAGPQAAIT